jgi:hypothetical protein
MTKKRMDPLSAAGIYTCRASNIILEVSIPFAIAALIIRDFCLVSSRILISGSSSSKEPWELASPLRS